MPRINIEDSIYQDHRFLDLCILEGGDRFRAMGILIYTWSLAQKWFLKNPEHLIPIKEWNAAKIPDTVITANFVERKESAVYVRGSEEQFAWLTQRRDAGLKNKGKNVERPLTESNGRNPLPLSLDTNTSILNKNTKNTYNTSISSEPKNFEDLCSGPAAAVPRCHELLVDISEIIEKRKVSEEVQSRWIEAFVPMGTTSTWLCNEIRKCVAWEAANPTRRKKNFPRYATNWLNRAWDRRSTKDVRR